MELPPEFARSIDRHLEGMIRMQREKLLKMARRSIPTFTADDLLSPYDFPQLVKDPSFNFEDGLLGGLIQAQISLRAYFGGSPDRGLSPDADAQAPGAPPAALDRPPDP